MSTTLVADIGGTKSRFAIANSSGALEHLLVIHNDTAADLDAAVSRYLEETGAHPRAATLAVAGPVDGEEVVLTNRTNWRIRRVEFAERFGLSELCLLNDFEAIAWALPHLGPAHTRPLGNDVPAREGVKVVLGPGTGLGVAALLPADGRWHVIASEGGHASFGPQAPDEADVFARLREECGSVSAETVLSGAGLVRLARALDPHAACHAAETIAASACSGALPADWHSRSRRWAASTSPAASPAGWDLCSTSRSSAPPLRRIPPIRLCSKPSPPCSSRAKSPA